MKMIFLVDGDNNIGTGLQGIDLLTAEDTVLVFFGKGQTLANVKKLCAGTKAQVQYLESVKGGKNSLDFQIITELGVLVGRGEADFAYVISQDKGYEAAMSALHARYASTFREVALRPSIQDCLQAAFLLRAGTREELAAAHKEAEERKLEISLLEEELEKAKQRLADTEAQLKESEEKLAKAGPAAAAYEKVKDRTAGIELEAHCRATAEAAMEIVCALAAAGVCLDETPVYAAALLHDVSKGTPDHALAGAGLMSQLGYPVLAPLIAQHHDIEDPARVNEALVVYMADKLCRGDRRVSVSGRFRASFDKCRDAEALAAHDRRYKAALTAAHTINDICGKEVIPI